MNSLHLVKLEHIRNLTLFIDSCNFTDIGNRESDAPLIDLKYLRKSDGNQISITKQNFNIMKMSFLSVLGSAIDLSFDATLVSLDNRTDWISINTSSVNIIDNSAIKDINNTNYVRSHLIHIQNSNLTVLEELLFNKTLGSFRSGFPAIMIKNSSMIFKKLIISYLHSTFYTGLESESSSLIGDDLIVTKITSKMGLSAVSIRKNSHLLLKRIKIYSGISYYKSGGLFIDRSSLKITEGGIISNCIAGYGGGGGISVISSTVDIYNVTFKSNKAIYGAGIISTSQTKDFNLTKCSFIGNKGGALLIFSQFERFDTDD